MGRRPRILLIVTFVIALAGGSALYMRQGFEPVRAARSAGAATVPVAVQSGMHLPCNMKNPHASAQPAPVLVADPVAVAAPAVGSTTTAAVITSNKPSRFTLLTS